MNEIMSFDMKDKEVVEVLMVLRRLPSERMAVVMAFINGMEAQKSLNEMKEVEAKKVSD